jgi:hypothetical protein
MVAGRKFIDGEPMNPHEQVAGLLVEFPGRGDLLQFALLQHRHAVPEGHGLRLVVRDIDGGDPEPALHLRDFRAHLPAQLGVEVRQRLVEQERVRLAHDRPAHGDTLPLAAREVGRLALQVVGELERPGRLGNQAVDLLIGCACPGQAQREGDVLVDRRCGYRA